MAWHANACPISTQPSWFKPYLVPSRASTHPLDWTPLQHSAAPLQAAMMFQIFKGQTAVQVGAVLPDGKSASYME